MTDVETPEVPVDESPVTIDVQALMEDYQQQVHSLNSALTLLRVSAKTLAARNEELEAELEECNNRSEVKKTKRTNARKK